MLSIRSAIATARKRSLSTVRDNLAGASQALEEQAAKGQPGDVQALLDFVAAWTTNEKRVKKVPE